MALRVHYHILKNHGTASRLYANSMNITMEREIVSDNDHLLGSDFKDDYIVKCTGAFGPWQAKICIIAALVRFTGIWNILSIVFLTPTTAFSCVKFKNANATFYARKSTCYENCVKYEFHEDVMFQKNVISEFNLVCDSAWKAGFTQTLIMFGSLVGVSLFGWISDRFGRRIGLIISTSVNVMLMIAAPLSPSYWIFNGIRFLIGITSGGIMVISLVLIIEIVGPQYREAAGSLSIISDGFAQALLSVFAYFAVDWKMYLIEYSVLSIFIYIFIISLPETPRWLIVKGKVEKALHVMTKAAERNKLNLTVSDIQHNILRACDEMMINNKNIRKFTYLDLFKTKELAFRTIASVVIWFVAGVCYFGIIQYITFIGSNLYVSVVILGCIQIPTCPLAMVLNKSLGRKVLVVAIFFLTGITMSILVFMPPGHIGCTVLGIVGFAATCTIYGVLCVYASELFPTPLRTMAFGLSIAGTKIGAMVAPFIATINPHWIPSLVFAILPFIASIFCIFLSETKGLMLLDII